MLAVMNSDGKLEFFSVVLDQSAILKKMTRLEKRQSLKRAKLTTEQTREGAEDGVDEEGDLPVEVKVDKATLKKRLQEGNYDLSLHFSKRAVLETEVNIKPRSF
jgi:hypothetical protein